MKKKNLGQALIELLVAIGVAAIFLPALASGVVASRNGTSQEVQRLGATALLRQMEEATRTIRENNWVSFAVNGTYHPVVSGSSWSLVSGQSPLINNSYIEEMVISDVYRDNTGTITSSGGTLDLSTKKIVSTVSWSNPFPSSVTSTIYLVRYDNLSYSETTQTDFNKGKVTNVKVQATANSTIVDDGEIVLSQTGGFGDWCNPGTPSAQLNLYGQGVPNGVYTAQGNGNVIGTVAEGGNASGVTLAGLNISDPPYPTHPTATISGIVSNTPKIKTNGIYNEVNYAYLATDQNANGRQGIIVDLRNFTQVGTLDLGSSANGQSIFVTANHIAFLTATNGYLYTFNVTNPAGSHSPIGQVQLAGIGKKVVVVGTNAYIGVSSGSYQLQIVDASDSAGLKTPVSISVGNGHPATDLFVNQTQLRAYLVTSYASSSQPDFFTIDINPSDSWYKQIINTFITTNSMNPTGVVAVSGARAIIVGTGSTHNYQVIGISSENVPPPALSTCGPGLTTSYNINGIATLFTASKRAYSYIITDESASELKIAEGGPGAGNGDYVPSGTFLSAPFGPTPLKTAFNNFSAHISQPQSNEVQLLFAVADPVGASCRIEDGVNYTFVGINGTAAPFESASHSGDSVISGTIPFGSFPQFYHNPDKCFKYQVNLFTNDSTLTPIFKDMTINYSP